MAMPRTALAKSWLEFLTAYPANLGVSVAYNPEKKGTVSQCYRVDGMSMQRRRIRTPGMSTVAGVNRLPSFRWISPEQVMSDLDALDFRLCRSLFGCRFAKLDPDQRMSFIGFIEHADTNTHAHLLWRTPDYRVDEFKLILDKTWRSIVPYGSSKVVPVWDENWAKYISKDQLHPAALESHEAHFVWNRSTAPAPTS